MSLSDGLYFEVNLISVLVTGLLLVATCLDNNRTYQNKTFIRLCSWSILFFSMDMCYILVGHIIPDSIPVNYVINMTYFIASGMIGFSWYQYASAITGFSNTKNFRSILIKIPLIILIVVTLTSPLSHAIFYIDAQNGYHRGPFHVVQVICMNVYTVLPCLYAIFKRNKNDLTIQQKYTSISFLIIWEVIAQFFQVLTPNYASISIGISMAILSVYVHRKNNAVSLDPLTQINNRNQLMSYMTYRLKSLQQYTADDAEKRLYLLIFDVDSFKEINDTYGHIEGDEALKLIATALKRTVSISGGFICRYGGDEFMLITEKESDDEMEKIQKLLDEKVAEAVEKANKPYTLTVSSGISRLSKDIRSFADLVTSADEKMYKVKRAKKVGRI